MQEAYTESVLKLINEIHDDELNNIKKAAEIIFKSMIKGGLLHVFATGHSHMMAEEMFYRAGGLVPVDPILEPFLMQHEGAFRSTKFERVPGISKVIYDSLDLKDGEPFLIVSNSGINAVPIEMAEIARKNNHPVIVVTSVKVSSESKSRVENGHHLYDEADVVIDNHVPYGDGVIKKDFGLTGAVSTVGCSYIAQLLVLSIIECYEKAGVTPPVYKSANTPGGDKHNEELIEDAKKRIKCLY